MARWQQIEALFEQALERADAERDAFLRDACLDDPELYRDVVSLTDHNTDVPGDDSWAALAAAQLVVGSVALDPGERLGPYEITSFIAAGGMGVVYRARDPRMGREVAIKVCPEGFNDRFSEEVRAAAALNHPNVCHVYDVGSNYLVMELVQGETLDDRIRDGRVSQAEALPLAKQIAHALEVAHERGVIHCDLKPGNIKITPDGIVKVLDFGLARRTQLDAAARVARSSGLAGLFGTTAYMSPEQVAGSPIDARSDIFAFGVVFYEMLSGASAFSGETVF
jgi:serine/threonine protein kinase